MKHLLSGLTLILGISLASFALAEIEVVVHPSNAAAFDKSAIQRIFLGKTRAFPSGAEAVPIALREGSTGDADFTKSVLSKTPKQLKAYWAKMVFTGKGTPPKQLDNASQVLKLVSTNPNLIGFIPAGSSEGNVKVVGRF